MIEPILHWLLGRQVRTLDRTICLFLSGDEFYLQRRSLAHLLEPRRKYSRRFREVRTTSGLDLSMEPLQSRMRKRRRGWKGSAGCATSRRVRLSRLVALVFRLHVRLFKQGRTASRSSLLFAPTPNHKSRARALLNEIQEAKEI